MYENKVRNISKEVFKDKNKKKYFILSHKKHSREMYFLCKNKKALEFVKPKFNSKIKELIYFMLKLRIIQPFLKKIELSSNLGQLILVGGQIKTFDLRKKKVYSFSKHKKNESFLKITKDFQKILGEKGFAPKVDIIKTKPFYSVEELCSSCKKKDEEVFRKLMIFYKDEGISKRDGSKIYSDLRKIFSNRNMQDKLVLNELEKFKNNKNYFYLASIHGDFSREQCLVKNNHIKFCDWNLREGTIVDDLVSFFNVKGEIRLDKEFFFLLENYPKEIKKDLRNYLILGELFKIADKPHYLEFSKKNIKNYLLLKNANAAK